MITAKEFFGGSTNFSLTAAATMDFRARLWRVTASGGTWQLSFPPNTTVGLPIGAPLFYICNVGATSFNIRDSESFGPVIAIAANRAAFISNGILNGTLRYFVHVCNYSSY